MSGHPTGDRGRHPSGPCSPALRAAAGITMLGLLTGLAALVAPAGPARAQFEDFPTPPAPNAPPDPANYFPPSTPPATPSAAPPAAPPAEPRRLDPRPVPAPELLPEDAPDDSGPIPGAMPGTQQPLVDVRVEGNVTIPAEAIARHVTTRSGRPVSETQIRADVRALYKTRWFLSVEPSLRPTPEGLVLVFRVVERPVVRRVEYKGNEHVKTKHLSVRTGIEPGSPFDVGANREACRVLEDYYRREKGFPFATVELEVGGHRDDREVVFLINEGSKVLVTDIDFEGNETFPDTLLKTKVRSKTAILWLVGGKYDEHNIPDDIAALKQYYHGLGYFDVKIEDEVQFNEAEWLPGDRVHANVTYHITEGQRYRVNQIDVYGAEAIPEPQIRGDMELAEGDFFNARFLSKDMAGIRDKYGEQGRLFAKVEAVPRFLEEPGWVDVVYQIDEDKVYRIRRVDVVFRGEHPHTRRSVVLNRIRTRPGELANANDIERSRKLLGGSGLFVGGPGEGPQVHIEPVEHVEPAELDFRGQSFDRADHSVRPGRTGGRGWRTQSETPASAGDGFEQSRRARPGLPSLRSVQPRPPSSKGSVEAAPAAGPATRQATAYQPVGYRPDPLAVTAFPDVDLALRAAAARTGASRASAGDAGAEYEPVFFRAQSPNPFTPADPFAPPQNPLYEFSPQGDPLDPILRQPRQGEVDLIYELAEAQTGRLMFGAGFNSESGVVGSIVLSEQNFDLFNPPRSFQDVVDGTAFRGGGQRFRLEAIPGSEVSRYLVSWTDPYFLNTDYSLSLSGFYYQRFFDDWDEERAGGRISVGYQLTPEWAVSTALRLEDVEISNPDLNPLTGGPQILADAVGQNFLSTGRVSLIHDTRDAAFLPGSGHRVELAFEQAFGDFDYSRAELEGRQFFTLYERADGGGRHLLTVGGQLGWTGDDTPIFERFFAGGFQTFRGFDFRGVGPREEGVRTGGTWLALSTVEYMFPLMANDMVHGVVFSDMGTVENDVAFDEFRLAVGAGVRLTVPALGPVPLAFDWAVPILSEDTDDERIFSFYIGVNR